MRELFRRVLRTIPVILLVIVATGCVHEWPEAGERREVALNVHHLLGWTDYDFIVSGTRAGQDVKAYYIYKVYRRGETSDPVYVFSEERDDLTLADFTYRMQLPVGEWDIYVWQEFLVGGRKLPFYDTDKFPAVTYNLPYEGDTDLRDAFDGHVSVDVKESIEAGYTVTAEVEMTRPFAKYVFVARDFDKFYDEMSTRFPSVAQQSKAWSMLTPEQQVKALQGFEVVAVYPFFMPAVYNIFTGKVVDSWRGINYTAGIRPLDNTTAYIAMDYVMINHLPSGAQVQLGLRTPDGALTSLTQVITVPLKRGQITYVYGDFLTNDIGSGLDIDFDFSGDFNIEI